MGGFHLLCTEHVCSAGKLSNSSRRGLNSNSHVLHCCFSLSVVPEPSGSCLPHGKKKEKKKKHVFTLRWRRTGQRRAVNSSSPEGTWRTESSRLETDRSTGEGPETNWSDGASAAFLWEEKEEEAVERYTDLLLSHQSYCHPLLLSSFFKQNLCVALAKWMNSIWWEDINRLL